MVQDSKPWHQWRLLHITISKRIVSLPSPCSIGLWSHCSSMPGSLTLRLCWAPAPCHIHALLGSPPSGPRWAPAPIQIPAPRDPCPSGLSGPQLCLGLLDPHSTGIPTLRPCWAPPLKTCQIIAPPGSHSGHHRRGPNLPKRHRQIDTQDWMQKE
jgi:hypothetical protein